ncbi:MAG: pyridoxal kinase PdxY [Rhodospirillaceae bacterium]|jgi:pyridoxine kinase|nr:pyridoxal kinase PdxY [Rhodospirillaceae bacterium]
MDILTIQSHVARGHVGLNAATLPLQLMGFEVDAVPTVVFSNHLGWPEFKGRALDVDWVRDVIDGVDHRGLERCRALLTGFIGSAELGEVVLHALDRVRAANPAAIYACDPVMGNEEGFFVQPGVPEYLRDHIVPRADILFPNHMELEFLVGAEITTVAQALEAARMVQAMGPRTVVVTSLEARAGFPDTIPVIAADETGAWQASVARLDVPVDGAGDLVAATFTAAALNGASLPDALAHALGATHGVMRRTAELGMDEMALVAAQNEIVAPSEAVTISPII